MGLLPNLKILVKEVVVSYGVHVDKRSLIVRVVSVEVHRGRRILLLVFQQLFFWVVFGKQHDNLRQTNLGGQQGVS
jgi:hypothetical protein